MSIVFDFASIHSRMLGEDKPQPKASPIGLKWPKCFNCDTNDKPWKSISITQVECTKCGMTASASAYDDEVSRLRLEETNDGAA